MAASRGTVHVTITGDASQFVAECNRAALSAEQLPHRPRFGLAGRLLARLLYRKR